MGIAWILQITVLAQKCTSLKMGTPKHRLPNVLVFNIGLLLKSQVSINVYCLQLTIAQAKEEHADPCHPTLHSNVLDGCRIMFPNTWGCHAATFMKSLLLRVKHVSSPSQVHSNHISNLPTNGVVKCKHWIILYFASCFPLYLRCAGCVFFTTIHWWLCTTNQLCQCNFRLGLTKLMKGITIMFLQSFKLRNQ